MSNYWQERFIEEEKRLNRIAGDEIRRQQLEYERAISNINKDIEKWYNRIAVNNEVSLADAKKILNKKEREEFKWTVEEYIKHGNDKSLNILYRKELENASSKYHIERLEALKLEVRGQVEKLYNNRESGFENHLKNIYKDQYNRTAFQIAKGTGVGTNIYSLNDKLVNTVIKKPWAPDGKNFSERIWEDKNRLINTLHTELTQGFIRGDSLQKMTDRISAKMDVSKTNAARLVHTESAAYASKARQQTFEDLEVEKFEVVATLDTRTSDICQSMDGKVFDMKDYEVGTTAPPYHVRCRSTTAPYFEDDDGERTARDTKTGKTTYVPSNMKYKEWQEKYLTNPKNENGVGKVVESTKDKEVIKEVVKEKLKTLDELSNDWYDKLSDEEKQEIFSYTTGDNMDVSRYTRGIYKTEFPEEIRHYESIAKNLDNAIDKFELDRDVKVYRTVQGNFYRQFGLDEDDVYRLDKFRLGDDNNLENYKKLFGSEFMDKGYVSSSLNINEPFRLNGDDTHTLFEINVKKGTKGAYLGKNSAIGSQEEFLLKKNTKFKIKSMEFKNVSYIDDYGQEITQRVLVVKMDTVPEKGLLKNAKSSILKETIPKTLHNHKEHLEKWYSERLKNLISKEDEKLFSETLKELIDDSDFAMRFKTEYIEKLIESGRFKNTFETSTSGAVTGDLIKRFRKQAPINLFGTTEKLKKIDYEKYGYVANRSYLNEINSKMGGTLKMYGDAIIKFNKENLKNRITFTVDDSLANAIGKRVIASSVDKPSIHSIDIMQIKNNVNILKNNKVNDVIELTDKLKVRYLETQYHGELLLSDVKEICFTDRIPNGESIKKLKKIGIKLYRLEGDKIVKI